MDAQQFDYFTRLLGCSTARRRFLTGIALSPFAGLVAAQAAVEAAAKKRIKRKKGKKPQPNAYGCLNVGAACRIEDQCCSGICEGKPGKSRCRAHHSGPCKAEFDGCLTLAVGCGAGGFCFRTTGQASFCGGQGGHCMVCARDADCVVDHGPGAACVVCDDCNGIDGSKGTACYPAAPDAPPPSSGEARETE